MRILMRAIALLAMSWVLPGQPAKPRTPPTNAPARLRQLSPQQRKMLLDSLPPERRKQAAERLDRLESLSPEERDVLDRRWQQFNRMSPEDREKARRIFREMSALPDERREMLRGEFEKLHSLSSAERSSYLKSREVQKKYSKRELQILDGYADLPPQM